MGKYSSKILIGKTPYTREQLTSLRGGLNMLKLRKDAAYFLALIEAYEENGYEVLFKRGLIGRLMADDYRIVAYKIGD